MIFQKAPNHCDKSVPYCFLHSSELHGGFLALYDLLYPTKTLALTVTIDRLAKKSLRYLAAADSLSGAMTNCFISPNFKYSGGNNIFRGSVVARI